MIPDKNPKSRILRIKGYLYTHPSVCLIPLMLLSLLLKIQAFKTDPLLSRDAALYCLMAQKWYDTGSYQGVLQVFPGEAWIPPGFLGCLQLLMTTGLSAQTAGLFFNILCGLLLIPVGYALAREITNRSSISLITAAFLAVHPTINELSTEIIRDISALCLTGMVLWLAVAGIRRKSWICWNLCAVLAGINFLFRYESIECIPVIGIFLTILVIKRNFPWKKAIVFSGVWLVVFSLSFLLLTYVLGKKEISAAYQRYFFGKIITVTKKLSDSFANGEQNK